MVVLNQLIFTVSTLEGCGSLERTDFEQLILWRGCGGLESNSFLTVSTFGQCGGLERTHFEQLILWEGVHILKGLILPVSTTGRCSGIERADL